MVVVPAVIPVTNPVLSIVATAVLEDVHGVVVAGVADPVNWVVKPWQIAVLPVIVGSALTVTTWVMMHPLEFV